MTRNLDTVLMMPYSRGKADFARGLALSANPFEQWKAVHFKAWNEGWLDAFNASKGKR